MHPLIDNYALNWFANIGNMMCWKKQQKTRVWSNKSGQVHGSVQRGANI